MNTKQTENLGNHGCKQATKCMMCEQCTRKNRNDAPFTWGIMCTLTGIQDYIAYLCQAGAQGNGLDYITAHELAYRQFLGALRAGYKSSERYEDHKKPNEFRDLIFSKLYSELDSAGLLETFCFWTCEPEHVK